MLVLKTASPAASPWAPNDAPVRIVPSSNARRAIMRGAAAGLLCLRPCDAERRHPLCRHAVDAEERCGIDGVADEGIPEEGKRSDVTFGDAGQRPGIRKRKGEPRGEIRDDEEE